MNIRIRFAILGVALTVVLAALRAAGAFLPVVPDVARRLVEWPTDETIRSKAVQPDALPGVVYAVDYWITNAIAREALPPKLDPPLINEDFDRRDVARHRWTNSWYAFVVGQSSSIFAFEIRLKDKAKLGGDTDGARLKEIRRICGEVFPKVGHRRTGQAEYVEIPEFNALLLGFSFDEATVTRQPGVEIAFIGRPKTYGEEGISLEDLMSSGLLRMGTRSPNRRIRAAPFH